MQACEQENMHRDNERAFKMSISVRPNKMQQLLLQTRELKPRASTRQMFFQRESILRVTLKPKGLYNKTWGFFLFVFCLFLKLFSQHHNRDRFLHLTEKCILWMDKEMGCTERRNTKINGEDGLKQVGNSGADYLRVCLPLFWEMNDTH